MFVCKRNTNLPQKWGPNQFKLKAVIIASGFIILIINLLGTVTLSLAQEPWTKKASLQISRVALSTCVVGGKIYAIGGWNRNIALSTVEQYDPASNTWIRKKNMPTSRYALSTSTLNGKIYAIGGDIADFTLVFKRQNALDGLAHLFSRFILGRCAQNEAVGELEKSRKTRIHQHIF